MTVEEKMSSLRNYLLSAKIIAEDLMEKDKVSLEFELGTDVKSVTAKANTYLEITVKGTVQQTI